MNAHNHKTLVGIFTAVILTTMLTFGGLPAQGAVITDSDIEPLNGHLVHSGNGQLDLILFTFANGLGVTNNEIKEKSKIVFNGDDANTDEPVGGHPASASESYITSMGDLRNFYRVAFPDGQGGSTMTEIVLTIDLCQTGQGQGANDADNITLNTLNILIDYDDFTPASDPRNDPWTNDISSSVQNSTGSGFSGGTTISSLAASVPPKQLDVTNNGSGWADYLIYTGINPFDSAYSDDTPILFFWESSDHHGGGTDVFISHDVPEPGTMVLLLAGGIGMLIRRRKSAAK